MKRTKIAAAAAAMVLAVSVSACGNSSTSVPETTTTTAAPAANATETTTAEAETTTTTEQTTTAPETTTEAETTTTEESTTEAETTTTPEETTAATTTTAETTIEAPKETTTTTPEQTTAAATTTAKTTKAETTTTPEQTKKAEAKPKTIANADKIMAALDAVAGKYGNLWLLPGIINRAGNQIEGEDHYGRYSLVDAWGTGVVMTTVSVRKDDTGDQYTIPTIDSNGVVTIEYYLDDSDRITYVINGTTITRTVFYKTGGKWNDLPSETFGPSDKQS